MLLTRKLMDGRETAKLGGCAWLVAICCGRTVRVVCDGGVSEMVSGVCGLVSVCVDDLGLCHASESVHC